MIPVNTPKIPQHAAAYLKECLKSEWISSEGPFVHQFEQAFANYLDVKCASSTNSGTSALHLALMALNISKGDEVILPASTIGSCYFAIWYVGAKAVPIDAELDSFNINPELIEKKITSKTKAIMVVHLYGKPCNMTAILKLAKKYKLKVIEDAAEAIGATYKGKKVGSLGDIGCFSLYGNKIVTAGEGGMVVSNNKSYIEKINRLKSLNFDPKKRFTHLGIGYKYLMTNFQAAYGLASLEEVEKSIAYKRKMAALYCSGLKNIAGITLPHDEPDNRCVYWMFAILIDKKKIGMSREVFMKKLQEKFGVQTRTFFFPPNQAFKSMNLYQNQTFPIAEKIADEGLYLPSGLGTSLKEFKKVIEAIQTVTA